MNLDKLDAAIAHIEAHPEQHNQVHWFYRGDGGCGTAACLAGTVVALNGWKPTEWIPFRDGDGEATANCVKDGVIAAVDETAMDILCAERTSWDAEDFNDDEMWCNNLFNCDNSIEDIKSYRDQIAAEIGAGPGSTSPEPGSERLEYPDPKWTVVDFAEIEPIAEPGSTKDGTDG